MQFSNKTSYSICILQLTKIAAVFIFPILADKNFHANIIIKTNKWYNFNYIFIWFEIIDNFSIPYTIGENIIANIKMRNNFCYPLKMVIFPILR